VLHKNSQAIQDRWCALLHLIRLRANADGDPAADGIRSETVGRCNKSVHEGENLIAQMKE